MIFFIVMNVIKRPLQKKIFGNRDTKQFYNLDAFKLIKKNFEAGITKK